MNRMGNGIRGAGMALVAVLASAQAPPSTGEPKRLTEPETGQHFPPSRAFPGRPELALEPLGVGHRKLFGVSYYSIAVYVDKAGLKRLLADEKAPKGSLKVLESGGLALCLDLRYTRGVSGRRRGEVIRERLAKGWDGLVAFEQDPEARKMMAFFSREARRGDESLLWFHPDGRIVLEEAGKDSVVVRSPRLRASILDVYFGKEGVSKGLTEALTVGLEQLQRPQSP